MTDTDIKFRIEEVERHIKALQRQREALASQCTHSETRKTAVGEWGGVAHSEKCCSCGKYLQCYLAGRLDEGYEWVDERECPKEFLRTYTE